MSDIPEQPLDNDLDQATPTQGSTRPMTPAEAGDLGQTRRQTGTFRPAAPQPQNTPPTSSRPKPPTGAPNRPRQTGSYPAAQPYVPPPPAQAYEPPPDRRRRTARARRDSGLYLPWWSLIIMLAFVGCAAFGALLVVNELGGRAAPPSGGLTPTIIVITATFTVGPPATTTPIPQPATLTPTKPLPTIAPTGTLPPGKFELGVTVQVVGVDISGLNVRSGPGVDQSRSFIAQEGEKFILKDGPQTASNEEWWQIQDPNNPNRKGWAVRRYLEAVGQGN